MIKDLKLFTFLVIILALSSCGDQPIEVIAVNGTKKDSTFDSHKEPILKVYVDNTGSMNGYMCNGSQLKDVVYDYISDLSNHAKSTEYYYINSQIINYNGSLKDYISSLNPNTFRGMVGNRDNTDIGAMLANIFREANDTTLTVFVSDCILDLPKVNSLNFLNNCQITIKNAVNDARKRIPDLGVEILKLSSDYDGRYFYYDSFVTLNNVKRPYYIWIFGDRKLIANLNTECPITNLKKYGLDDYLAFTTKVIVPFEITNVNLTSNTIHPIKGDYKATIRANYNLTLQPESAILSLSNYSFVNTSLHIDNIAPIANNNNYTHYLNITIPKGVKIAQDNLVFKSPNVPSWVSQCNDDTGKDIEKNIDKTTGIKNLIQGVADAFKKDDVSTNFSFSVKRK